MVTLGLFGLVAGAVALHHFLLSVQLHVEVSDLIQQLLSGRVPPQTVQSAQTSKLGVLNEKTLSRNTIKMILTLYFFETFQLRNSKPKLDYVKKRRFANFN